MKRISQLTAVLISIIIASCTPELEFNIDNTSVRDSGGSEMSISSSGNISVVVTSEGGSSTVQFSVNKDWEIIAINSRAESWCSVTPTKGSKGTITLSINTSPNYDYEERNASFSLKCEDKSYNIVIKQKQKDAVILSSNKVELDADGGNVVIEVKHNISFSYEIAASAASWIKESGTKGLTSDSVSFSIEPNRDSEPRSGSITFKSEEGSEVVNIFQQGFTPSIILSQTDIVLGSDGGTIPVEVKSNMDISFTIDAGSEWIVEDKTKAMSTNTYYFTVLHNETYDQRDGSISFKDINGNLSETLTITQMQKDAIVIAKDKYDLQMQAQRLDITVLANVDIQVETPEWIQEEQTKGLTEKKLSFNISENNTGEDREGEIRLSNGGVVQVIKVRQYYNLENSILDISNLSQLLTIPKESVTEINFHVKSDKTTEKVSKMNGRYPIYAETSGTVLDLYTQGDKFMIEGSYLFREFSSICDLDLKDLNTSLATQMEYMFFGCSSLTSLDLSGFDTSNVTDMSAMFCGCSSLTSLDLSGFNTSNVTTMYCMFYGCSSLTSLDISEFDTSNVTDMKAMFNECSLLTSLDLSGFNTSNVTTMCAMFYGCNSLTSLDISEFDTSNVTEMNCMFFCCESLTALDLSGFDTSNITDMSWVFYGCSSLKSINLKGWNMGNVTTMYYMFGSCSSLLELDLSGIKTSHLTNMSCMFDSCHSLKSINLNGFYTGNVTNMEFMFDECYSLEEIDLSGFDTSNVKDMHYMFGFCTSLKKLCLTSFNTSQAEQMYCMFYCCNNLEYLDISSFDVSNAELFMFLAMDRSTQEPLEIRATVASKKIITRNGEGLASYYKWILVDGEESFYQSSDFTKDGEVRIIQKASTGNGVNLVFMGDAYSDRQIADGTYSNDIKTAVDALFEVEPYKSLKSLFNIYEVTVVSPYEYYDGESALEGQFSGNIKVSGNDSAVVDYALRAVSEDLIDKTAIAVIMNSQANAGTAYMYYPSEDCDYGNGLGIGYIGLGPSIGFFGETIRHELGGHAFAKLDDEYFYEDYGRIPPEEIGYYSELYNHFGWVKNVDFTSDLSSIKWSRFISDSRYADEKLGAYEGAATYLQGAWRPTDNSIMRDSSGEYNAPSREAIFCRINKLAYGESWEYDYETFVAQDLKSKGASSTKAGTADTAGIKANHVYRHTAPVIIKSGWKQALLSSTNSN